MSNDCGQTVILVDLIPDHDVDFVELMFSSARRNFIPIGLAYEP